MQSAIETDTTTENVFDRVTSIYVEYDDVTKEPLALIETAIDQGQQFEMSTAIKQLAMRISPTVPAYVVLYTPAPWRNPADPAWPDIASFRVRRIWPEPVTQWEKLSPQEWAERLCRLRHEAPIPSSPSET